MDTVEEAKVMNRFLVDPTKIDWEIIERLKVWSDAEEITIFQLISEAKEKAINDPKYTKPFELLIPPQTSDAEVVVSSFESIAKENGGDLADWIDLSFMWAYKLSYSEINLQDPDTNKWHRVVKGKNGYLLVGGSTEEPTKIEEMKVSEYFIWSYEIVNPKIRLRYSVPLVRLNL